MKYYKADSRKLSFREYRNISWAGFPVAVVCKVLRIPLKLARGIAEPVSLRDEVVGEATVPLPIRVKLNSSLVNLRALGFDRAWFHTSKDSLSGVTMFGIQTLHQSGTTVGRIVFASHSIRATLVIAFVSRLQGGSYLSTTNSKPGFEIAPGFIVNRCRDAQAAPLWELHQSKLAEHASANPSDTFRDFDDVVALNSQTDQMFFQHMISRGIFVEMADAEVEALRAKRMRDERIR